MCIGAARRPSDVGRLLLRDVVPVDDELSVGTVIPVNGYRLVVERTASWLVVGSDLAADEDGPRCDGCRRGASL